MYKQSKEQRKTGLPGENGSRVTGGARQTLTRHWVPGTMPDEITFHQSTKNHPFLKNLGMFPFLPGASNPSSFAGR